MRLDPTVWGPHYWFFLHTVAHSYPKNPNAVTKRKYYDLIINMPLFIPHDDMGDTFAELLNKYPVTPYLDNRESFMRWVTFIHNKINNIVGHPEISYLESLDRYESYYKPKEIVISEKFQLSKKVILFILIVVMILLIYYFY
jgi:hypothetical protein